MKYNTVNIAGVFANLPLKFKQGCTNLRKGNTFHASFAGSA